MENVRINYANNIYNNQTKLIILILKYYTRQIFDEQKIQADI